MCIPPKQSGEFVYHMEDVLEVYHRPYDPRRGLGSDRLVGASGDDVLIGGALDCRFTLSAVRSLGAAWSASSLPVLGLRLTGPNADVSDSEVDHLTRASGADWFIVTATDKYQDTKAEKKGDAVSVLT